ncbi:MAG: type III-B CRISPR module RAMP protein Cmr1 [Caldilineaceae bacterium]|nr:type III-B CRISPR module RAMP protein Cmr1 [Caldilineaceae bacterium]
MEISLRTLTPIWTGGVETGTMDRIHETGIIGSLRWWYEAIVRGLGSDACDPTSHSCIYDPEKPNNGLCDVCQLFGATGWRRRFRLAVSNANLEDAWSGGTINVKPPDRNRGWYLNSGKTGTFDLKIMGDEKAQAQVLTLIQFVSQWGSLGARPQLGYGFVEIVDVRNPPSLSCNVWTEIDQNQIGRSLPDLRTFTFFILDFEPQQNDWWRKVPGIRPLISDNRYRNAVDNLTHHHMIPTTPALKNVLRYGTGWSSSALPHQFFGTLRGNERRRGQIALSWAYQQKNSPIWRIRGWTYPPQVELAQQQEIQQRLQAVLGRPETLLRALNIQYRSATVSFAPATTFFQPVTSKEIQSFVSEASVTGVSA